MSDGELIVLRETGGRVYAFSRSGGERRIRGVGRIDPDIVIGDLQIGDSISIGTKKFVRMSPGLPELRTAMVRRAQVITPKDAGFMISWMGIGQNDRVLEAGFGSGGLAMHIARSLGPGGTLISVERREEHASVGTENMLRCADAFPGMPTWTLLERDVIGCSDEVTSLIGELDAIILDMPEPWTAIPEMAGILRLGGRIACYCPSPEQLAKSWASVEESGLTVEWAGELMERRWTLTKRGGARPGNTPIGHTALLLIAVKAPTDEEE
ncbi:MAG: hypothetical protein QGH13_04680 [Candidatus Thalassarchaeaceae archaeon]|nr:hypothetical protein [Candidatus Thalassarchaeaceae archaeon]